MNSLTLFRSTIRYIFSDFRIWLFFVLGLVGSILISRFLIAYLFVYEIVRLLWLLTWRRSLASFIITESQVSPASIFQAFKDGFFSLIKAGWLSIWYFFLLLAEMLLLELPPKDMHQG